MHHYQFNIGDYKKDTAHLSLLEHGIYRMLIDSYYTNEGPLEADDAKLMRTHCVRSADEQQAYQNVINDFFEVVNGAYKHEGCDKVLAKIYEKSDKARESAAKRWAKKNKDLPKEKCAKDANAMRTHSEGNANGMLPITHNPLPNIKPTPAKKPTCPTEKIIELFKTKCTSLVQPRIVTDATKGMIADRWRQDKKHQDLAFWEKYFDYCESLDFLAGRTSPNPSHSEKPFRVGLEWIVKSANFAKIINGNYANA